MENAMISRRLAVRLLTAVVDGRQTVDEAVAREKGMADLAPEDRHFVRLLVMTCLRHMGQIDGVLEKLLKKPLPRKQKIVRAILRLGVAQGVFLKTPGHAFVHTSVAVTRAFRLESMTGFVNGVLRALTRLENPLDGLEDEAVNFPKWLVDSWQAEYGAEVTRAMMRAMAEVPPLDITVKSQPEVWAQKWNGVVLPTGSVRVAGGNPMDLEGFADGCGWVQNAAASVPASLFSDVQGKQVADLCAAPGGKTAQLAVGGAKVTAYDISERRLARVRENMERLGFQDRVKTVAADALQIPGENVFDAVLLDAPCSATGTLRRHPELKWIREQADIVRLAELQKQLLGRAVDLVRVGGEVVFATCSLQPEEGDAVIQSVLDRVDVLNVPEKWVDYRTPLGGIRLRPDNGYDGFYLCHLKKR